MGSTIRTVEQVIWYLHIKGGDNVLSSEERKDQLLEEQKLDEWDRGVYPDAEKKTLKRYSIEYVGEFLALIDACGQVSYYENMLEGLNFDIKKVKNIASAYRHDKEYYSEQTKNWSLKAWRSLEVLKFQGQSIGIIINTSKEEDRDFLRRLKLSKDRRKCFKGYLTRGFAKEITFSPDELEEKYQLLLKKRLKKAMQK